MFAAFVDESGSPSLADGSPYFAVAVLVMASSRSIHLHVRRTRRRLHRQTPASELKAAQSEPHVIRRLLQAIANESCEIYGLVVDKRGILESQAEPLYRWAIARAIALAAQRHPELHVTVDRRYTKPAQRLELELRIREAIVGIPDQVLIIAQADSTAEPGLQAVDFVAWALRQKYEGIGEWAGIIEDRIVMLELAKAKKIAALPGGR